MYRIAILEDDDIIRNKISSALEKWSMEVLRLSGHEEVLPTLNNFEPHLIILDITLPKFDGYYYCQEVRKTSNIPLLFLSSRHEAMDQIMALTSGGDDYVTKPFHMEVLISKVKALLRRAYDYRETPVTFLEVEGLGLDVSLGKLTYGDHQVLLTKNEQILMKEFMNKPGQVLSRDSLIKALWEEAFFIDDNTLTVNITRLRKKLKSIGADDLIHTQKGRGYYFEFI